MPVADRGEGDAGRQKEGARVRNKKKVDVWEKQARQKLEEIYRVHGSMMMRTAMGILKQKQDAEDALQNSIISLARHMDALGDVGDYRTVSYVRTVVKHAAIDIYRKRNRGHLSYEELLTQHQDGTIFAAKQHSGSVGIGENGLPGSVEELVCSEEGVRRIVEAIANLGEGYREVLSLFYLNELSPREIADVLHRPYNTVRSQINRGRKALQNSLKMGDRI